MADETKKYAVVFEVIDKAGPKIDALIAKLVVLDKILDTTKIKLKDLGTGNRGLGSVNKNLDKAAVALKMVEAQAVKTQVGLKSLGDGVPLKVDRGTQSVSNFGSSLLALHAGQVVVHKVTEALDAMGDAAVKAREFQDQGAQSGLDQRGKAREYATLMQKEGPDDEVMSRLFGLAKAGGYKFDDALKYGEQFLGSSPAGVQAGHVTPDQLTKLESEGAKFANRIGLDPATGGDLAGVIPQYIDLTKDKNGNPLTTDQGVQKAMGQLGALHYGLNEGRGKITTLARSEIGVASAAMAQGRISDHAEMGAFVGIASTFTKTASGSGNGFKQMDALINRSEGDEGEFLDSIGVSAARGDRAKLQKLKEHIDATRAGSADPSSFDTGKYLASKGFGSREEKSSTIGYLANLDVLDKRIARARALSESGQGVIDANRQYGFSLEGQNQLGDAAKEKAEYDQTRAHQRTVVTRKFALAQLRDEGKIDTTASNFKDWADDFVANGYNSIKVKDWSGDQNSMATRIDERARENLVKSGHAAGIDVEQRFPGFSRSIYANGGTEAMKWLLPGGRALANHIEKIHPFDLDQVTENIGPELEKKGIGLDGGGAAAKLKQAASLLTGAANDLQKNKGGAPPARPSPAMNLPSGGGFTPGRP
jgi:hypothetical protein